MNNTIQICSMALLIMIGCGVPANGSKVSEVSPVPDGGNEVELVSIAGQRIFSYNVENLFDTKADRSIGRSIAVTCSTRETAPRFRCIGWKGMGNASAIAQPMERTRIDQGSG